MEFLTSTSSISIGSVALANRDTNKWRHHSIVFNAKENKVVYTEDPLASESIFSLASFYYTTITGSSQLQVISDGGTQIFYSF